MKPEDLLDTIGDVKDEYVIEAEQPPKRKKKTPVIPILAGLAACLCLAAVGREYLPALNNESAPAEAPSVSEPGKPAAESMIIDGSDAENGEPNETPAETYSQMMSAADYEAYALASAVYPEGISMPIYEDYFPEEDGISDINDKDAYEKMEAANKAFNEAWDAYFAAEDSLDIPRLKEGQKNAIISFAAQILPLLVEDDAHDNLAFSPVSLYYALTMAAETVAGDSRSDLLELVDVEDAELSNTLSTLWKGFFFDNGVSKSLISNSLWVNEGVPLNQDTLNRLAQDAYASSFRVEMGTEAADKAIAGWLNDQTENLLVEYTEAIRTDPDTWLQLYSTVYYYDQWASEFNQDRNTFDTFTCGDGREVEAEFMNKIDTGSFVRTDRYQFASLALKNSTAAFILPAEGVSPEDLLADQALWSQVFRQTDLSEVEHYGMITWSVPKFDISSQLDLMEPLKELGLSDLFDGSADFSPLSEEDLLISSVTQSARILADEKGLSAAAYTELAFAGSGAPEDECDMILDRPFILVIKEQGVPLFVGIINTP